MMLERDRKLVEAQVKDMHARLDEAEHNALKVRHLFSIYVLKNPKVSMSPFIC
jgi:hypothetical protein